MTKKASPLLDIAKYQGKREAKLLRKVASLVGAVTEHTELFDCPGCKKEIIAYEKAVEEYQS